jgi:hypothetical protein
MPAFGLIPTVLGRRMILAFLGYRCLDGVWCGPGPSLSEEQLDAMSDRAWRRFIARWLTSATATT